MSDIQRWDASHVWHPFTPLQGASPPLVVARASGAYLYTDTGREILDGISSWWVNLHGHSHPRLVQALQHQAETLDQVIFAGFTHEPAARLAHDLLSHYGGPYTRVFYSDDGSTAVEVALKLAIEYHQRTSNRRIRKVLALEGGYHGDTFGAMSAAARGLFTRAFAGFLFEAHHLPFPTSAQADKAMDAFRREIDAGGVAAFIFEPRIQAAGGMRLYADKWLDEAIGYAQRHEVPCIADEVFTGFGRTGDLFACSNLTHKPDLVALSKGITGGMLPLGATLCSAHIAEAFSAPGLSKAFFHGHSYTANPMACRVGIESLSLLCSAEGKSARGRIAARHKAFALGLSGHPRLANARTIGPILAMELQTPEANDYTHPIRDIAYDFFLKRNILLRPLGQTLYFLPPYVATDADLMRVYDAIEELGNTDSCFSSEDGN